MSQQAGAMCNRKTQNKTDYLPSPTLAHIDWFVAWKISRAENADVTNNVTKMVTMSDVDLIAHAQNQTPVH
jgi:hypothetical protein